MARCEFVCPEEIKTALERLAKLDDRSQGSILRRLIEKEAINKGVWVRAIDPNQPAQSVRHPEPFRNQPAQSSVRS